MYAAGESARNQNKASPYRVLQHKIRVSTALYTFAFHNAHLLHNGCMRHGVSVAVNSSLTIAQSANETVNFEEAEHQTKECIRIILSLFGSNTK